MTDLYLMAATEAEMLAALTAAGVINDEQIAALEPISVQPTVPYRVWA